ncbi:MAG TPA: GlsB/YeaQ/YmgE family stress response membrane protein [bacterium]|nr:GlsB/YeaQ/YmgE family stress response membrane protein [bacterium]
MYESMQLHNLIWFLIVGGLAGWLASVMVDGGGLGILGDIVIGVIGAFLGGFLADVFGVAVYGFWGVLAMSIVGAIVLLVIIRAIVPRRRFV